MQIKDSKRCEEMQEKGMNMDCIGCSCSVCIAQEPDYYKKGLKKAIEIIDKEIQYAITANPQIIAGMLQIKGLIQNEIS